jgi:hypothetical protein
MFEIQNILQDAFRIKVPKFGSSSVLADQPTQLTPDGRSYKGSFDGSGGSSKLRILPEGNSLVLNLAGRE